MMSECVICNVELCEDEISWCDKCSRFACLLVGSGFEARPSFKIRNEMNDLLSNDRGRTLKRRWRTILEKYQLDETDWAFDEVGPNHFDSHSPWYIDDEQRDAQLNELRSIFCVRDSGNISDKFHFFQRGIPLDNCTILSMINNVWAIDGNQLPKQVPYDHILRALTGNGSELKNLVGCDWLKLLTNLILASRNSEDRLTRGRRNPHNPMGFPRHFMRRLHGEAPLVFGGANLFLNWMNHLNIELNPPYRAHYDEIGRRIRFNDSGRDLNWELLEGLGFPWVARWREMIEDGNQLALMREWAGPSLRIHNGKVQLRTIKNGKWVWSQLPPWPRLWALLSSWALSPPTSKEHQRLRAIQWCWQDDDGELVPDEPGRRALTLLRQICDESDQLTVPDDGRARIYVEGTSGMFYEVGPGPGAHGARFTVSGAPSLDKLEENIAEPLCIHEDGNFKRLPVGDVISSVVLTLIDDLKSAEKLEPLSVFIRKNKTFERVAEINEQHPHWIEAQRQRFRRRRGNARWLNTFPAVYRVFVNLPLGSIIRIPRNIPNPAIVDNTEVVWMIRNQAEVDLVSGLARLAGFRSQRNQGGEHELWERVEVPINGVRRDLVEMLGPYERRHGRPGEPPWWNLFPNPVAPNQLLERLPNHLNIPLDEDLIENWGN